MSALAPASLESKVLALRLRELAGEERNVQVDFLLARAAFRTRAEVEHLVASVQARTAPRAGLRKLPERAPAAASNALPLPTSDARTERAEAATAPGAAEPTLEPSPTAGPLPAPAPALAQPKRRAETLPVSEGHWSLRVTLDRACKEDLETLRSLLSHKIPDGDLGAVLQEAIRCAIEKHGKRKGAVAPQRESKDAEQVAAKPPAASATIPAIVRRAVWKRDGGRCAWVGPDGCRCNSHWKLELDHIQPAALGGASTIDNLRLACRAHNLLHAERTFGREHMDRFRRGAGHGPTPLSRPGVAPSRPVRQLGMWAP